MSNNVNIFFNNFDYLLSINHLKITDIETSLGQHTHSSKVGYFSRLRPSDGKEGKLPSIETLLHLSDFFKVSIDALLNTDLKYISNCELKLDALLRKLQDMTVNDALKWSLTKQTIYQSRNLPFYLLTTDVPNLGLFVLKLDRSDILQADYFTISIQTADFKEPQVIACTLNQCPSLIPNISTLYQLAQHNSQALRFTPCIESAISDFLKL